MEDKRIITRFLKSELLIDNKNSSGVLNANFLTPHFQFKIEIRYIDDSDQNIMCEADKWGQEEIDKLEKRIAKLRFNNTRK